MVDSVSATKSMSEAAAVRSRTQDGLHTQQQPRQSSCSQSGSEDHWVVSPATSAPVVADGCVAVQYVGKEANSRSSWQHFFISDSARVS